jgi:exodeoxyribonuclease VII small subunit
MEHSNLPLEESILAYEEGTRLVKECRVVLDQAEKRIQTLTQEGLPPEVSAADGGENDDLPF